MERTVVKIGHGELEQLIYRDKPVVTFAQIAQVHGTSAKHLQNLFRRHKQQFLEGEDYFHLDFAEASSTHLKDGANSQGLTVFTEDGYLLLVKPMRDEVSWKVQRQMRAAYFLLRQSETEPVGGHLVQMAMAFEKLEAEQRKQQRAIMQGQQDIIAVQQQQIALQQDALETKEAALEAKEAAIVAIQSMQWVTIRQYVEIYRLQHQMPQSVQQRFATWLTHYCMEHNSAMYKAVTADRQWPNEKTYCIAIIQTTLPGWLKRYGFALEAALPDADPTHETPPETEE
jgi:ORF6N domain